MPTYGCRIIRELTVRLFWIKMRDPINCKVVEREIKQAMVVCLKY